MGVSVSRRDATPCALLQKEASQRQQRRSVAPASQRRSVAAPTASQRHSSVAASQRQQRRSVTGPTAASQRHSQRRSVAAPTASQRHWPNGSVAASQRHPPPGASQRNVGNPRFGPLCPCTVKVYPMLRKMSIQWEQRSCRFVSHLIRMFNRLLESKWKDG